MIKYLYRNLKLYYLPKGSESMEQTVYGDILFIINFSMDFLSLYITSRFLHYKAKLLPLSFASAIGAAYAVAELFLSGKGILSILINLATALLMCYIVFGKVRLHRFFLMFCAVSFLLGGCMTALYSLFGHISGGNSMSAASPEISGKLPIGIILPIAICSVLFSFIWERAISSKKNAARGEIEVVLGEKSVKLSALSDSGNLLTEPISGVPVILTGCSRLLDILPYETSRLISSGDLSSIASMQHDDAVRIKFIPSTSVGGEKLLIGFMPDYVVIDGVRKKACVAFENTRQKYDGAEALMPEMLV